MLDTGASLKRNLWVETAIILFHMKTLITIDWDYFVPEKVEWDLGHRENLLFLRMMWGTRGSLLDQMKTSGAEVGFWDWLRKRANLNKAGCLFVSDSHAYVYPVLKGVSRVVLFDAHHDCWESEPGGTSKNGVYCHDWLRVWLKGSKKRRATWVKPDWQDACTLPDDMKDRVDVVGLSEGLDLGLEGSLRLHVCRSGCWTPPWLDGAFLGFLNGFRGDLDGTTRLQEGEWDPLVERWTSEDLKGVLENQAKIQEMAGHMKGRWRDNISIGSIPSSDFLNAKVEQKV